MNPSEQVPATKNSFNDPVVDMTSPGKIIERARESAKLSQADLAQRLRLDTKYIRHLELDNFEQLPGPTFIKGYLRSIAKELNIAGEPLLEAYRRVSKTEREPTLADFESRPPPQVSSNNFIVKAGSYALAITLVLLLVFWWQSNGDGTPTAEDPKLSMADTHTNTPLPYEFEQVNHDADPYFVSPLAELRVEQDIVAQDDNVEQTSELESALADEAEISSSKISLSLSTTAESWVEIYDTDGKQLYFGMANIRTPITLESDKPLDLLIGNTPTVELTINGESIDLQPLSNDGVAKFEFPTAP